MAGRPWAAISKIEPPARATHRSLASSASPKGATAAPATISATSSAAAPVTVVPWGYAESAAGRTLTASSHGCATTSYRAPMAGFVTVRDDGRELRRVLGDVEELPHVVLQRRTFGEQPRDAVAGDRGPALVVDAAVAEHLEVLQVVTLRGVRLVEAVEHAGALHGRLLHAVQRRRFGQPGRFEDRWDDRFCLDISAELGVAKPAAPDAARVASAAAQAPTDPTVYAASYVEVMPSARARRRAWMTRNGDHVAARGDGRYRAGTSSHQIRRTRRAVQVVQSEPAAGPMF